MDVTLEELNQLIENLEEGVMLEITWDDEDER